MFIRTDEQAQWLPNIANILGMTRKKETDWLHATYVPKLEEEVLWMCARL